MDWTDYLRFAAALIFVVSLMGGFYLILKRLGLNGPQIPYSQKRLKVIEMLPIDSRRRAMILQCDDKQHLVILSPTGETVIETRIKTASDDQSP